MGKIQKTLQKEVGVRPSVKSMYKTADEIAVPADEIAVTVYSSTFVPKRKQINIIK